MISIGFQPWASPIHQAPCAVISFRFFQIHTTHTHSNYHLSNRNCLGVNLTMQMNTHDYMPLYAHLQRHLVWFSNPVLMTTNNNSNSAPYAYKNCRMYIQKLHKDSLECNVLTLGTRHQSVIFWYTVSLEYC